MASIAFGFRASDEPGAVEVRIGSTTGPIVARAPIVKAAKQGVMQIVRVPLVPTPAGTNLYFNFHRHKTKSFSIHWYAFYPTTGDEARDREILAVQRQVADIVPEDETPVLFELPQNQRRVTRVFERGNWMVPADTVVPGSPGSLPPLPKGAPANRLGLAQWLTIPENPLTARVTVNRYWAQFFGTGIVETLEDFGTMGAAPSHPELLDWMAVRFMKDHKWSVKSLQREIVPSATYRQSSRVRPKAPSSGIPRTGSVARGPARRLSAELVRGRGPRRSRSARARVDGKSVLPPQPGRAA